VNRTFVYPSVISQDTDILSVNQNVMIALGYLAQMMVGTGTYVSGLACTPGAGAVNVGPGCITALSQIDPNAYGSLGTNTAALMKMGINVGTTILNTPAPGTAGQSINYLIEAIFSEADTGSAVLPYYNAANPALPFSGPSNSGGTNYTVRAETVTLVAKAGTANTTGSQTTPAVDTGYTALWVATATWGSATPTIAQVSGAPFIPYSLGVLSPGFKNQLVYNSNSTFVVPSNVSVIQCEIWGAGGAGGAGGGSGNAPGGGGGAGGYLCGNFSVAPGSSIALTVGSGTTTVAGVCSAAAGSAGGAGSGSSVGTGAAGGSTSVLGTALGNVNQISGNSGGNGIASGTTGYIGGSGGGAFGGAGAGSASGAISANIAGGSGTCPGAGGSGGLGTGAGGAGAGGKIIIRY
jgi:hypothetical protein